MSPTRCALHHTSERPERTKKTPSNPARWRAWMGDQLHRFCSTLLRLWLTRPRLRTMMLPTAGILATLAAFAPAAAADGTDDYKPGGIGDMMPSPFKPPGQGTLFESTSPDAYHLDKQLSDDLTGGDLIDGWMHGVGDFLAGLLTDIGRATVVVVGWCFNVVSMPDIEGAISRAIAAAAGPMMQIFLPAAVAIGGFVAWAKRSESSPLGQIAWVAASAAIATTFLVAPSTWVKGVDNGRQLGANVAMTTIGSGLTGSDAAMPFKTPEPQWSDNAKDNTIRRAGDAVWRTYVATPWCVADLGSVNACQRWGYDVIKMGTDMDAREDFLSKTMNTDTVGKQAVRWRQGHNGAGRVGVLFAAIVSCAIFAALAISLACATLASLIGALMLLVCGVAFATLWCIPGKPRQWGVQWFEMLLGLVMVSFTSTMLLGSVMVVSVSLMSLLPTYGWLMVSALNICAAVMAFKVKGRLDGIVSAGGAQMAGRGVLGTLGRMARARRLRRALGRGRRREFGDMDRHPAPDNEDSNNARGNDGDSGSSGSGASGSDVRSRPTHRFPPPPSYPPRRPEAGSLPPREPAGPTGPTRPAGPAGTGPAGSRGRPGTGPRPGPRRRPGTTTAGGYTVRPGTPRPSGPPDPSASRTEPRVIQGTVINRTTHDNGSRFRSYPPPPSAPARPTRPATARVLVPAPSTRPGPAALPRGTSDT
ncbi:hypothetical protein ACF09H_29475 [Streptomyces sp. NPDC014983]|uniref:hypothetical protein n=1 Tax=Streptomyces sp. NPDC014983 TaxID=3364933 RepID=UPI0036F9ADD5